MNKNRLEAFSDGVMAIIITIMVLEIKVPHGVTLDVLTPLFPIFLSYVLSFIYLGIYWNNHHHMLHTIDKISAPMLWANLHLLFWLSLIPFTTGWAGENHFASLPSMFYGIGLLMSAIAYSILQKTIIHAEPEHSLLKQALGKDFKGKVSIVLYATAVAAANFIPKLSLAIYVLVALFWLIPDRRIEQILVSEQHDK